MSTSDSSQDVRFGRGQQPSHVWIRREVRRLIDAIEARGSWANAMTSPQSFQSTLEEMGKLLRELAAETAS
jgi:hypothetical protein